MSRWTDALLDERTAQAKKIYARLNEIPLAQLSPVDRAVLGVLAYWTLESDDPITEFVEADLYGG